MGTEAPGSQSREYCPPKTLNIEIKRTQKTSGELPDFRKFGILIVSPLLVENRDKYS